MWFDNLNFSSADRVNWTVQDLIDNPELKIEIKDLTKKNLKKLFVDIENSSSHLRLRDENWNIIWKVKDREPLEFLDKKIIKHNGKEKIFLKVKTLLWKEGYLPADYIYSKGSFLWEDFKANTNNQETSSALSADTPASNSNIETTISEPTKIDTSAENENTIVPEKTEVAQNETLEDSVATPEKTTEEIKKELMLSINTQFIAFKGVAKQIDQITMSSLEKKSNKDLLDTNYNALIALLNTTKNSTDKDLKSKYNEIMLYLAKYYADEWWVDNDNFVNYKLSNKLAFDVLWELKSAWKKPKAPEFWDIISEFKWTGIWTYITSKINEWEELQNIFSSKAVKNAGEEKKEELLDKYYEDLELYLENIDKNHKDWLSKKQKQALELLMDVNWAWWSIANKTTDMIDIMGWDFAAIWAWIWAWALAWGAAGSIVPVAGNLAWLVAWGIVWWAVTTVWMMVNHGDDYFSEDRGKWLTELWINSIMFWVWGGAFKAARWFQWTRPLLSSRWVLVLALEGGADVTLWTSADITRAFAYNMDIEISDAIANNLMWALLPMLTINWVKWVNHITAPRLRLGERVREGLREVQILSRLWETTKAKRILDRLKININKLRNKEPEVIERYKDRTWFVTDVLDNGTIRRWWETYALKEWTPNGYISTSGNSSIPISFNKNDPNIKRVNISSTTSHINTPETSPSVVDSSITKIFESDLSIIWKKWSKTLEVDYQSHKVSYNVAKKEYTLTDSNGQTSHFPKKSDLIEELNRKITTSDQKIKILEQRLNVSLKKEFDKIKGKEIVVEGETFRLIEEGDNKIKLQKKSSNNSYSEVGLASLTEAQQKSLLSKALWENNINMLSKAIGKIKESDIINEGFKKRILDKYWQKWLEKAKKLWKWILWETKNASGWTWWALWWLIKWNPNGWLLSARWKVWMTLGIWINEFIEYNKNPEEYKEDFISFGHAGSIMINALWVRYLWWARNIIWNELAEYGANKTIEHWNE